MKKILFAVVFLYACFSFSVAQVNTYTFAQGTGSPTYLSSGYTEIGIGTGLDEDYHNNVPIGFYFNFNGIEYSSLTIHDNGYIVMGSYTGTTSSPISSVNNSISALGADLQGLSNATLRHQTLGSAPNRRFVAEWRHFETYGTYGGGDFSFQIILYEGTNVIQFVYQTHTAFADDFQVGLRGNNSADYSNRKKDANANWTSSSAGTATSSVMLTGSTSALNPGGIYTWTPKNMIYVSSTTTQTVTTDVGLGASNQEIIGVQIVTQNTNNPLTVSSFTINTNGSTAPAADISRMKLWSTGTSSTFATTNQIGNSISNPSGSIVINSGSNLPFTLVPGTNYFWITYDIEASATINNYVDAECDSISVGGTPRTPTVQAPSGSRQIKDLCTSGIGTGLVNIDSLPYNSGSQTTCGMVNNLKSSNTATCGDSYYLSDEDVVYVFTPAVSGCITINLTSSKTYSGLMLYHGCPINGVGGTCVSYQQSSTADKTMTAGVIAGETYYLVIDSWTLNTPHCLNYTVSISTPSGGPANSNPCNAVELPVGNYCSFNSYTNECSGGSLVPNPGCAGYSGGDVWFKVFVPASGNIVIDTDDDVVTDGGMAIYSGADCNSLTLLACNDDGSENGYMPMISLSNQTPGAPLWIRFWEADNNNNGTFGICAYQMPDVPVCVSNPAAGDHCTDATPICNLNGYCGNTSATYDSDEPGNLYDLWVSATIENNSWLKFVAENDTVVLNVWVSNCVYGDGIQMRIVGTSDCNAFAAYSNFWNPEVETDGIIMATGLTIGETYYLVIDGYAGDVCDYVIGAGVWSGVLAPNAGADTVITAGACATLSATGGTGFQWSSNPVDPTLSVAEQTQQTINVCPTVQTTYTVTVTGGNPLCPSNGTDEAVVYINSGLPVDYLFYNALCSGDEVTIDWSTASETNCDYFLIEKSVDGELFYGIKTMAGHGNSNDIVHYSVKDADIHSSENYYRIKQVDFDGQYNYSPVMTAICKDNSNQSDLFVNYSNESMIVHFDAVDGEQYVICVYDVQGRKIHEEMYVAGDDETADIELLLVKPLSGVYLVSVESLSFSGYQKCIIQ
ncbi:MAG TPA: BNR-repeat neuraminidase N-terminal domain-containing protein [Bacteroidales bacterium]|nr:BNR-repeat neuraminidase N-terminal domain-containing protein [Bacteroidales bacterium]